MTAQTEFWSGDFGDEYAIRNLGAVPTNIAFFAKALRLCGPLRTIIELGAGTGQNLVALKALLTHADMIGLEVNEKAARMAKQLHKVDVWRHDVFDVGLDMPTKSDLVLSKGFGIHVPPDQIETYYEIIGRLASKYVLFAEYYNPTPLEVQYRNHDGVLWKRDFAGEFLDRHPEWELRDYGFQYHDDPLWPQDDLTWFLLERTL